MRHSQANLDNNNETYGSNLISTLQELNESVP